LALTVHVIANLLLGGGALQDSAWPVPWLFHQHAALRQASGQLDALRQFWWYVRPVLLGGPFELFCPLAAAVLVFLAVRPRWPRSLRALPAFAVGVADVLGARNLMTAGWTAILLAGWPRRTRTPLRGDLLALGAGLTALLVLHYVVRQYPRDYYFAPLAIGGAAALLRLRRLPWVLLAAVACSLHGWLEPHREDLRGQEAMAMCGRFVARVLPAGEALGVFNSGLVGWLHDGPVVNLDGVVDARAFAALQRRDLDGFLDAGGVRFVADNPAEFSLDVAVPHSSGRWIGAAFDPDRDLVEVARFGVPGVDGGRAGTDSFRLYWRRGRGAPPPSAPPPADLGRSPDGGRYVLWPARPDVRLEIEQGDRSRCVLVRSEVATVYIVKIPRHRLGTGRLFAADRDAPELVVPVL
jgi:hypothetical protein